MFESLAGIALDLIPVVGDVKGFWEAETPFDYTIAAIGALGPLGDAARVLIKEAKVAYEAGDVVKAGDKLLEARTANNVALHEAYKDALRESMERPVVADAKLNSLIDSLYRPNAKIGNGSTAAAVRYELEAGQSVGGVFHSQKAKESIVFLQRWLDANPRASTVDRAAAENLIADMRNALKGK